MKNVKKYIMYSYKYKKDSIILYFLNAIFLRHQKIMIIIILYIIILYL